MHAYVRVMAVDSQESSYAFQRMHATHAVQMMPMQSLSEAIDEPTDAWTSSRNHSSLLPLQKQRVPSPLLPIPVMYGVRS
jgi:hypothetical protein